MRNHTKIRNMKQKNKRSERPLASLLLVVMLTLGCICTGTVQTRAAVKSSLAEQNMNRSSAASNTCSHKWVKKFGENAGSIVYLTDAHYCGCGAGPFSPGGLTKHNMTGCMGNYSVDPDDDRGFLAWRPVYYKECSICGERKAENQPATNLLGTFAKYPFKIEDKKNYCTMRYKITDFVPEKAVIFYGPDDGNYWGNWEESYTLPDTVKKKVRITNGDTVKSDTFKVTAIGKEAFKYVMFRKITIGANITSIGKNAFKGASWSVRQVVIKTTKLNSKNVADTAFKGLNKDVVITVPKSKLSAYKKLFKKKGFKGKVKAGTWKEPKAASASATDVTVKGGAYIVKDQNMDYWRKEVEELKANGWDVHSCIDFLDKNMVEKYKKWWLDGKDASEYSSTELRNLMAGANGNIADKMTDILAWMDDDTAIKVSKKLGGGFTIREFLEAYLKEDPNEDVEFAIMYASLYANQ